MKGAKPDNSDKKSAFLAIVDYLSERNTQAIAEAELYLESRKQYYSKYEDDYYQWGLESHEELEDTLVLVFILERIDKVIYRDWKSNTAETLKQLDELSNGKLKKAESYNDLISFYESSDYGISTFLEYDKYGPQPFACANEANMKLLDIDTDSDSHSLILVRLEDIARFKDLVNKAEVNVRFWDK